MKFFTKNFTGRSAAWLARLVRDQEVGGSNPPAPTMVRRGKASRYYIGWKLSLAHHGPEQVRSRATNASRGPLLLNMKKRLHIYYSGVVQGVGFRFTAERLGKSLGLAGWVKNLRDGRVEVLCEGEEADLVSFINEMKNGTLKEYIDSADIEWEEPNGGFTGFQVRF